MNNKSIVSAVCVCTITLMTTYVKADTVELLTNGDFDAGPGTPWVESGNPYPIVYDPTLNEQAPYSESYLAWLGGDININDSLSQTFVIPDQTTSLDLGYFWLITSADSSTIAYDTMSIYFDGSHILSYDNTDAGVDWNEYHTSLLVDPGVHTLTFVSSNDSSGATNFYLDNVSLTANVVPVPAAVWLFGSGLIGLIGVARRKSV